MDFLAHFDPRTKREQSVKAHLTAVRDLAYMYGESLNISHITGLAGWLHDAGKYSDAFQRYLRSQMGEGAHARAGTVNHAFAGAQLLRVYTENSLLLGLIANPIMAHHNSSGPFDYMDPTTLRPVYYDKLNSHPKSYDLTDISDRFFTDFSISDFRSYVAQAERELNDCKDLNPNQAFYLRFVASCLVDADHLETAAFMSDIKAAYTGSQDMDQWLNDFYQINEKAVIDQELTDAQNTDPAFRQLNELRHNMSNRAFTLGNSTVGLYSMSIPTGGGKTFASLRFALASAKSNHLHHIIYVVPFTTVIEQNAEAIRDRLGLAENSSKVLEYHSAIADQPGSYLWRYAKETWDAPLIMTTQVAYLDALYGKGSKNLRHMHRLVNSAIIYDEVQSLPLRLTEMNNDAVGWLTNSAHSTVLLCTATQPALSSQYLGSKLALPNEIVSDVKYFEAAFARTEIVDETSDIWDISKLISAVCNALSVNSSVLVVLNTKAAVKAAYTAFKQQDNSGQIGAFILSTNLVAAHRREIISKQIKPAIQAARDGGRKVVVFSTPLIEAGVDLSFAVGFRSLTGLPSIIQTAGRVNRNAEEPKATVYVFRLSGKVENTVMLPEITKGAAITSILIHAGNPLMTQETVKKYFEMVYRERRDLAYPVKSKRLNFTLRSLLQWNGNRRPNDQAIQVYMRTNNTDDSALPLYTAQETVANLFQVIDSATTPIIVHWAGHNDAMINGILNSDTSEEQRCLLLREAQQYTVQLWDDPSRNGDKYQDILIHDTKSDLWILRPEYYDDESGMEID
ncbi:CRISPR-associated endonuclease Cas3'' [Schleiferilactobacillus shenzhenensis]|nr:CRISPR-associated endonuclease Cas3'' [Schleiferilactobacillus shenzhenensis]